MELEGALHPSLNGPLWPGQRVFFHYNHWQGDIWHERLLLCQSHGSFWTIITPDNDIYCEDVDELMWCPARAGQAPRALAGRMLYRFVDDFFDMPEEELRHLFMFGILEALRFRRAAGVQGQPPGIRAALAAPGFMDFLMSLLSSSLVAGQPRPNSPRPRRGVLVAGAPEAAEQPAAAPGGAGVYR